MKTVVITGCSTGFGRVTALHLAREGWQVLATVRKESDADSLKVEAGSAAGRLTPVLCDITQAADVTGLRDRVDALGGRLDGLVNNAGTSYAAPLELLPIDVLRQQLEVNLVAHLAVTQSLLPALKAARGTLINVSSVGGRVAYPVNGAYHMSKFALEAMSDVLRLELVPFGVKVVVLQPGTSPTAIWQTSLDRAKSLDSYAQLGAYTPLAAFVEQVARHNTTTGFPPEVFARTVHKVLTRSNPATRYAFPAGIRLRIWQRTLLPDKVWDWFVRRVIGW